LAVFALTQVRLLVDSLDVAGFANDATWDVTAEELDVTTLASAWRQRIPGLDAHSITVSGFQDFDTGALDPTFPATTFGLSTITFCPTGLGATVADPCIFGQARNLRTTPLTGTVGAVAGFKMDFGGTSAAVRGQVLHPLAARTVTGNGTTTTFTTPTAGQTLYAAHHVTSVTGSGTITFNVQTDNSGAMSSPTTRIATPMTAVGGSFASLAGALAGETHIRVAYTISGFTSVTFAVAVGVG
jgi:hypothetical protein